MNHFISLFIFFISINLYAESKLSLDVNINSLKYQKPPKGVGHAGTLIFSSANVNNNGIVLNINNINNLFDSQIFVRPTFLGFTTQFGNYGLPLENESIINSVNSTELKNTKLVLDDNQLNIGGESLNFTNTGMSVSLGNFRLYCQNPNNSIVLAASDLPANDMMKNCFSFLTLNGSYLPSNDSAKLELISIDSKTNDKTYIQSLVHSFDLRKSQINANLGQTKIISNDNYLISTNEINLICAKDEDLKEIDVDKIKNSCLNDFKLASMKATLVDQKSKTKFNLDLQNLTIKAGQANIALNSIALSDLKSTTTINNLILNCKKSPEADVLNLMNILQDCIDYSRISLSEVKSSKPDEKNTSSSVKNIVINSTNSIFVIQAEVKFLGINTKVAIYGNLAIDNSKKQLILTVTDTKLPLGINSVKLLMYFLKKNLISKDININNNIITISL